MEDLKYIRWVQEVSNELTNRKRKNKSYSLRAYARDLDVSPSTVSRLVNSDKISVDKIIKISMGLRLPEDLLLEVIKELIMKEKVHTPELRN